MTINQSKTILLNSSMTEETTGTSLSPVCWCLSLSMTEPSVVHMDGRPAKAYHPLRLIILFKINFWPTKRCVKNSLFVFTPWLPRHSHPVHWDHTTIIVCQSLESRPTQEQEFFTLVPCVFGTASCCLYIQPFRLLPLGNIWRHISLTLPSPNRYWHAQWTVDVAELFSRFYCVTMIWLSLHWAWLR